jgi:hypothetical protein
MKTNTQKGYILNDWDLIVATMHYRGVARTFLNGTRLADVAARGDGYGKMTVAELKARELLYDWSHVRDSSPAAVCAMAARIRELIGPKDLLAIQRIVAENNGEAVGA